MPKEPKKLAELFHDTLKDIYFAEKKILATLPKMAKAARYDQLRECFEAHLLETEGQIERLNECFTLLDESARGVYVISVTPFDDRGALVHHARQRVVESRPLTPHTRKPRWGNVRACRRLWRFECRG